MVSESYKGRKKEISRKRYEKFALWFGLIAVFFSFALTYYGGEPEFQRLSGYTQILSIALLSIAIPRFLGRKLKGSQLNRFAPVISVVTSVVIIGSLALIYCCANVYVNWWVKCLLGLLISLAYTAVSYIDENK